MIDENIIDNPVTDIIAGNSPTALRAIWVLKINDIDTIGDLLSISKFELKEISKDASRFSGRVYSLIVDSVENAGYYFKEIPTLLSNKEFNLSPRTVKTLHDQGKIDTIEQLITKPKEEIKKLYHIGIKSYEEILDFIHLHGLSFIDEEIIPATENRDILEIYNISENDKNLNFLLYFRSAILRKSELSYKNKKRLDIINRMINDRFNEVFEEVDIETINEEFKRVFGISREDFDKKRNKSRESSKIIRIKIKEDE